MRFRLQSVEFKLARLVRNTVDTLSWIALEVFGLKMVITVAGLSVLGFIMVSIFNVSSVLAFATAFGVYVALGGWRHIRVFVLTAPRDIRIAVGVLLPLVLRTRYNIRNKITIPKTFKKTAATYPKKACFLFKDETWTFSDVNEYSNRVANFLLNAGYQQGDVIAIYTENCPQFVGLWLGMSKAGIIGALINFNLRDVPLSHSIKVSEAKAVILGSNLYEAVEAVRPNLPSHLAYFHLGALSTPNGSYVNLDSALNQTPSHEPPEVDISCTDRLFYIYTSGTTGLPKAAIVTHLRYFYMAYSVGLVFKITDKDVLYTSLPLYHTAGGILGIGQCVVNGTTVAIRSKFSASQFWIDCVRYKATVSQYIGEICRYLLAQPYRPEEASHSVRVIFGNGIKPQIWTQFQDRFKVKLIGELYGATEGNCNIVNSENRVGAVGFTSRIVPFAYPITLIKVNPETNELMRDKYGVCIKARPGEPGELVGKIIKSNPLRQFDGYVDDKATSKKIIYDVFKKGDMAFSSGDILVMDDLGFLYFRDRTGDTFRWRGENVSTNEVEAIISNVIKLNDAVVYGVDIEGYEGKAGMAAIVDENGNVDLNSLGDSLVRSLPSYAKPMFLRFIKQADTTGTFKLKKVNLKGEGFNPNKVKDKMFYYDGVARSYQPLTPVAYENIIAGNIRL